MRGHKYHAVRTNGYASKAEADYAAELKLRRLCGDLTELEKQVKVPLVAGITWTIDFKYRDKQGRVVYDEVKGMWTPDARLKLRLWKVFGPALLRIVQRENGKLVVTKEVVPDACKDVLAV